jgi:NADH dehydrogenase
MHMNRKKHVVVLGGGFGGLEFIRRFKAPNTKITLIDRSNHHLFQPLLYQVAVAGLTMPDISEPLRAIFSDREDVSCLMDTVENIDLENKTLTLGHGEMSYDYLVIGLGAVTGYFGNPKWEQHAQGLKTLRDAMIIRRQILKSFEQAEVEKDEELRRKLMTIAIIGAGPTGVELAGAISELAHRVFLRDFRHINPRDAKIILMDASDKVLNYMPDPLPEKALKALKKMDVDVRLNTMVEDIDEHRVTTERGTIEAGTIIWTAGVVANPITRTMDIPKDKTGRLKVEADCSLPGHPEAFAIGDIAHLIDKNGVQVPGVSPAAIQMGSHVADILRNEITGEHTPRPKFAYWDKGIMATIGRSKAVAALGGLRIDGFVAWFLWLAVHLMFLIGFRNKVSVLLQWIYAYSRFRSGARIIVDLGRKLPEEEPLAA